MLRCESEMLRTVQSQVPSATRGDHAFYVIVLLCEAKDFIYVKMSKRTQHKISVLYK